MNVEKPVSDGKIVGIDEFFVPEKTNLDIFPCPKCGDKFPKTKAAPGPNNKRWNVWCTVPGCKAHLKHRFATEAEAIIHWNWIKRK